MTDGWMDAGVKLTLKYFFFRLVSQQNSDKHYNADFDISTSSSSSCHEAQEKFIKEIEHIL